MSADAMMPAPPENPEATPFFDALSEGRFIGRRCCACARFHWYPRSICPFCSSPTEWVELSGRGTIYSYSRMERVPSPYVIAYVTLEEGPTMLTRLVNCDYEQISIGKAVRAVFVPTSSGRLVPCFTLGPS